MWRGWRWGGDGSYQMRFTMVQRSTSSSRYAFFFPLALPSLAPSASARLVDCGGDRRTGAEGWSGRSSSTCERYRDVSWLYACGQPVFVVSSANTHNLLLADADGGAPEVVDGVLGLALVHPCLAQGGVAEEAEAK